MNNKVLEGRMRMMMEMIGDELEDKHGINWEMWKKILEEEIQFPDESMEVENLERKEMLKGLGGNR